MKIAFNMLQCGLDNNGGTRTIIKCAEVLEKLGHRCDIVSTVDNFNWFEHKAPVRSIPRDADVVVATACTTVNSTLKSNAKKKAWYIRGHEAWVKNEKTLSELYNNELFKITNSNGLKKKVEELGGSAVVVPQGVDLDWWKDLGFRNNNDKIRIGCLYQKKPTKGWSDFVELAKILGHDRYEYVGFGNTMRSDEFLTLFLCQPSTEALNVLYSSCHIWISPSVLEGLSNVPMEAILSGCLLVGNDNSMNGMVCDYLFSDETGVVYPAGDMYAASKLIENPDWELIPKAITFIKEHIGDRETNMRKFIGLFK